MAQAKDRRIAPERAIGAEADMQPLLFPEKEATERWIGLGVFAATFLYLYLFRRTTSIDPDEGIILQGAERILHGQVLYRDFFSFFTPGSYYLLAGLFRVFGDSILVARDALALYGGLFSVFTYLLARRVCSRWSSLLTAYLVTITCLPWRFMTLHNWDSTLWACFTLYCAILFIQTSHWAQRWVWALAAGSFASLTVLFEQSKGVGLILGLGLGLSILFLLDRRSRRSVASEALEDSPSLAATEGRASPLFVLGARTIRLSRADWIALGAGILWPVALTLGYFAAHHALAPLGADWAWPFRHYARVNSVPYGYQDWSDKAREMMFGAGPLSKRLIALLTVSPCFIIPALPIGAALLLVYWVLAWRKRTLAKDRAAYYILVCSGLVGLLLSVIAVRKNITHFVYLIPLFYLVLAWLMDGADIRSLLVRSIRPVLTMSIFFAFTALGMAFLIRNQNARAAVATRRGWLRETGPDLALQYVQAHVPAGSAMFVYPYLPLFYYLTATTNPTRFEYLQPGMHTYRQDEEAIREISEDRTPVVLFEPSFDSVVATSWPNTPLQFLAKDPVADYILSHYHPCRVLIAGAKWRLLFMRRDDFACRPGPGFQGDAPK